MARPAEAAWRGDSAAWGLAGWVGGSAGGGVTAQAVSTEADAARSARRMGIERDRLRNARVRAETGNARAEFYFAALAAAA